MSNCVDSDDDSSFGNISYDEDFDHIEDKEENNSFFFGSFKLTEIVPGEYEITHPNDYEVRENNYGQIEFISNN